MKRLMMTVLLAVVAPAWAEINYTGYHGPDGRQVYPNSNPPVEWDGATGKVLAGSAPSKRVVPNTTQIFAICGNRIYGLGFGEHGSEKRKDDGGAKVLAEVFTLDGTK